MAPRPRRGVRVVSKDRASVGGRDDPAVHGAATAWKSAGGRIDLDAAEHRFWLDGSAPPGTRLLEEVAEVDRPAVATRRISTLPFRRPIGLAPRLARAAANLARIGPGDRVLDPFLGTGALLAEAALLGARITGIDQEAAMVQGALRNFSHLGVTAERLVVGERRRGRVPRVLRPVRRAPHGPAVRAGLEHRW